MKSTKKFLTTIIIGSILTSCASGTEKKTENVTSSDKPTIEVNSKKESAWKVTQIKDEFGDIVEGKSTIAAAFEGTMSNSAVSDEDLTVRMQVQDSTIYSLFYEYGREPQSQLPDSKYLTIKVKVSSGEVLEAKQFLYKNMMLDTDKELLNILLNQDKPVKVIADISRADKYSSGVYLFEIDPSGLKEAIK
jgi:ribosome-binding protein aMBF1 (putative translation factor)